MACEDETCLLQNVAKLRPWETGIIISNPGFHRMHQIIIHASICQCLNCWKVKITKRNPAHTSLKIYAESRPNFAVLQDLVNWLARCYVADSNMYRLQNQPVDQQDQQYKNAMLFHRYTLLYEEISCAMNNGDIGCIETSLPLWIFIFRATGKHKYA
jgi:hypothetical protein